MAAPSAIVVKCENCGETTHRVLKGKLSGRREIVFEGVVKCQRCGRVSTVVVREPRSLKVPMIISWMQNSERLEVELKPDMTLDVGDSLEHESGKVEITAIESNGRRVLAARAEAIDTLWAKRADKVRVKVTIAKGGRALTRDIFAAPDEELCVGGLLEIGRERAVIERIKMAQRMLHRGCARASEIKRLYVRAGGAGRY